MGPLAIRLTRKADCVLLPAIEESAATAFRSIPTLSWLADGEPISVARHLELLDAGICLLADRVDGLPIAFIATEIVEADLHIWELSVAADAQRQGIGKQLLTEACGRAKERGLQRATLTTFRDVPWNAPFYSNAGFNEIEEPRLSALLAEEARHGLSAMRRCAMAAIL